jgi:hypothetical protein
LDGESRSRRVERNLEKEDRRIRKRRNCGSSKNKK